MAHPSKISEHKQHQIRRMRLRRATFQHIAEATGVSVKTAHRYGVGLVPHNPHLAERRHRAKQLRARGLTFLDISNALDVSPSTAQRLVRHGDAT